MRRIGIIIAGVFWVSSIPNIYSQVTLSEHNNEENSFTLVSKKEKASLYYDVKDFTVVQKAAQLFKSDIKLVSGKDINVCEIKGRIQDNSIIVGTLGHNKLIDELVSKKKIDVSSIKGKWECYQVQMVRNPFPGINKVFVVVGSDRRGTAYGLLSVSEAIGVSPWYWWADAPVKKQSNLYLEVNSFASKEPSVKYRGIFINDEDWGLYRWAKRNYEKERGNFGPKTYSKICELLLRLKANYLCPAMHDASMAFHRIPENRLKR